MITCQRCGKENQDHYKFCLGCGAELSAPPKAPGGGGDMAMMKTMMADVGSASARPTPPGGVQTGGLPGVAPGPQGGPGQRGPRPGTGAGPGPMGPGGPGPMGPGPGPMGPGGPGPMGPGGPGGPGPMGPGPMGARPRPGTNPAPMGPGPAPAWGPPPAQGPGPMGGPGGPTPAGPPPGVPSGMPSSQPSASTPPAGGPAPATGPRPCPSCGTEVPPAFKFCGACGHRMEEAQSAPSPRATADFAQQPAQATGLRALITLIRPDGSEGGTHNLVEGENIVGREHADIFEQDGYLSPTHAELIVNAAGAVVRDLDSLNGVFVRMTEEEPIEPGQVLRIGQELLRFDTIEPPEPTEDGTEVMGSPNPGYWGKITVIIGNGVDGSAFPLLGDSVTMGRERGDINFPDDGYVSGLHARLYTRDGKVFLSDLGSSNGTFIKVQGERAVNNGSFVLLGQQLFRLNLNT